METLNLFIRSIFIDNMVFAFFFGMCSYIAVSKSVKTALGLGAAVTFVMLMATAATWPIYNYLLVPNGLEYLNTIAFILVIAALVQLVEIILKKYIPALYTSLGVYLPLITTNCAILGVTLLNVESGYTFVESMVASAGAGIGFLIAMVLFTGVRSTLEYAKPPKSFEGLPITLVAASLVAVSFMGFGGIIESLFGTF